MTTTASFGSFKVLLVEDNPADARMIRELVADLKHLVVDLDHAPDTVEAIALLSERQYDLILADLDLPSGSNIGTVSALLAPDPRLPLIVLTGADDPDIALEALRCGAQDFLVKGQFTGALLERSMRYALERNRMGRELHDTTTRLESLLTSFKDVAWSFDAATMDMIYMSAATELIYGRTVEEFERDHDRWDEVVHQADRAAFQSAWSALECEGVLDLTYRIVRPDGSIRWLYDRGKAVYDEHGNLLRFEGIASDITERRTAEEELALRDIQYRELLEQASDGIVILDASATRFELINTAAATLLGYSVDELLACPVSAVIAPEDRGDRIASLEPDQSRVIECTLLRKDGTHIPSEISINRLRDGRIQNIVRDISERKRSEQTLRESEERFRAVVNCLGEGLLITDLDDTVLYVNPAACHITGYSEAEFLGKRAYELMAPGQAEKTLARNRERFEGKSDRFTHAFSHLDGRERWIEAIASPFRNGEGTIVGTIGAFTDVTERVVAEQQLRDNEQRYRELYKAAERQAQELALLNEVANRLADDIAIDDIFRTVVDAAHEILGYSHICISTIESNQLVPRYSIGYQVPLTPIPLTSGLSGKAATSGHALLLEHVDSDPCYLSVSDDVVSNMCIPLQDGNGLVGVLNIESAHQPLTERDLHVAEAVATQVKLALHRARLFEQMSDNEAQLRAIIDNATDAIYIKDLEGRFLQINKVVQEQLGLAEHQILGRTTAELVERDDADLLDAIDSEVIATGKPRNFDRIVALPDGEKRYLSTTKFPYRASGGEIIGVAAISRDISDRLRSEQLESGQSRVLEMVVRNEPLDVILTEVVHLLEKLLPGARCAFYLANEGLLQYRAAPSLPQSYLAATDALPIEATMGSCGAAFHSATPSYCHDVANEALWEGYHHIFAEHGIVSLWSVPIRSADRTVLGLLNLHFEHERLPAGGEQSLLASGVRMAAVAVEHGRLLGQLTYQAKHDTLTGLSNRFDFEEHLGRAIGAAQRNDQRLGLLFIDLDRFKQINDTLGHQVGDQLLIQVAERLRLRSRKRDLLARMGGDEFALLLTDLGEPHVATRVAQNMVKILEAPFEIDGREMFISGSIGVSIFPDDADDATALLANVDRAMYQAKALGKNNFFSFMPDLNEEAFERLELENHLRRALDKDELSLAFQPEIDLGSGDAIGFEALLRWNNGVHGFISPAKFIPLAEETGLIIPIGEWVLRQACLQNIAWRQQGHPAVKMAVNVSALQFSRADFYDIVERVLTETGHPPEDLILEVTESVVMHDIENVARKLERFRDRGIGIAIDDFGTGYSSLSYLKRLPVDIIKIDRAFVIDLGVDSTEGRGSLALVQAVVTLAAGLGISALAEGVETDEQCELLRDLGCSLGQGYLFAKPRPGDIAWSGITAAAAPSANTLVLESAYTRTDRSRPG